MARRTNSIEAEDVSFAASKYGPELLVDAAWIHDMPTFFRPAPHRLDFYDILLVTQGEGEFFLDGHRHEVRPGAIFFTAPRQIRHWQPKDLDGICLFFVRAFVADFPGDPEFVDQLPYFNCDGSKGAVYLAGNSQRQVRQRFKDVVREIGDLKADSLAMLRAQTCEVLIALRRIHAVAHPDVRPRDIEPTTARFRGLVRQLSHRTHRVAFYAERLGVSANYLNALCRIHLGRTAKSLISEELAVEARRALAFSDRSIDAIASDLGFKDPSYFTRFFQREAGVAPSVYRAQHRRTGRLR